MDESTVLAYKNRLLNAGIPYSVMKRNLRELQDHHDDLLEQGLARGLNDAEAKVVATQQLGNSERLASAMLARSELRSKLHRYPVSMTVLLPLLAHFVICVLLLIAFLYPAVSTQAFDRIDRVSGTNLWLVTAFELLRITLMYVVTPLLGCYLSFVCIRNHVPRRYWITGLALLCLLGSFLQVRTDWSDPVSGNDSSLSVAYFPGDLPDIRHRQSIEERTTTLALRFSINLLLCGAFARAYRNKEQTAAV
jgi:hypothetical protein